MGGSMAEWKNCLLEDLIVFQRGHDLPKTKMNGGAYPVVGSNGIIGWHDEYTTESPSITIGRSGNVGKPFLYYGKSWSHNTTLYIKEYKNVSPLFMYYFLKTLDLGNYAGGSAVPTLNRNHIHTLEVCVPTTIEEQNKIAGILALIDDKIEQNNKINKNLEQQAQALFKSWFVDFDPFGGKQPSEMKFIPLQELCKVVTKGTTPTTLGKTFTSSGINFIKAESILDNHFIDSSKFAYIDEETNLLLKRSIIQVNDIVFTIAGTLGRFAWVDNSVLPANTNQAVAIIRPDENKITASYLYSFFIGNWQNDYYSKRVQQAVQANLSLTTIKSLPIAILNNDTMNKYDELVNPLFSLMKSNEEQNGRLSKLRDTLLSKLMLGELNISNLNI